MLGYIPENRAFISKASLTFVLGIGTNRLSSEPRKILWWLMFAMTNFSEILGTCTDYSELVIVCLMDVQSFDTFIFLYNFFFTVFISQLQYLFTVV